jgi:hypothetical protein
MLNQQRKEMQEFLGK